MRKYLYVVAACLLFACKQPDKALVAKHTSLPYYTSADLTPHWKGDTGYIADSGHRIPSFRFTDQAGKQVTEATFAGKIYVANFFFTACPGICKILTTNLKMVQQAFANDDRVLLLSHSVTPEQDTVARLRDYAHNFKLIDTKWHLVTGDKNSIYAIARKAYFADEDLGEQKDANDFLHTENVLLIDQQRKIRGVYKGTSPVEIQHLVNDIKTLEEEQ